ncbi:MAG: 16S rRNA (cytosine(967)-C(5))-methyltransferase RsmB [Gemmatimonadales bacterium]
MTKASGIESRRAALRILEGARNGRPFDGALGRSVAGLPEPDRRLAHELAAGVLRQRSVLDERLAPLVPRGWASVAVELQDILRLGAYQLTALERVPVHAAVDTSVTLAKDAGGIKAAGFVNAVLRRLTRSDPPSAVAGPKDATALAAEYSHPQWLVRRWVEQFGVDGAEALLRWNNARPRLTAQAARADLETLRDRWRASGIEVEPAPFGAGLQVNLTRPADLPGYGEGAFVVQNPAQALLARFAELEEGAEVYDACAAPGGKTIALGSSAGSVVAGDISRARSRRLKKNVERAGSGREHVVVADARYPAVRPVDAVLLDTPCLGTGTFARHPDARWRVQPEHLTSLVRLQAELLDCAAEVVAPGGLLLYSTCSIEPEENRAQVDQFLARHTEFRRESPSRFPGELLSPEGDLMVLPQQHGMDGAYAARLRRTP